MRLRLMLIIVSLLTGGCWSPRPDFSIADAQNLKGLKGTLVITLSDTKSRYKVVLDSGKVKQESTTPGPAFDLIRNEQRQKHRYSVLEPVGYRLREPSAVSPDGKFLAAAMVIEKEGIYAITNALGILELPSGKSIAVFRIPTSAFIDSITWSPDSQQIAVLSGMARAGKSPADIMASLFGHPVSYVSFYLHVLNLNGESVAESKLASNFQSGFGHISWR